MFCYQCEQAARGSGCTQAGVCGKSDEVATLQDLLVHATKGIGMYMRRAGALGAHDREVDRFVVKALFTTVTNVNFDVARMDGMLRSAALVMDRARGLYENAARKSGSIIEELSGPARWMPASSLEGMIDEGREIGIGERKASLGPDVVGLQELLTYGLKGMAAYADHAAILGHEDRAVYDFFHEALDFLALENPSVDSLLAMNMKCGRVNLRVMELLDRANTGAYGNPVPTSVRVTPLKGKAILVSGHDLKDLEDLLRQTEGKGINVYTHGEMLPAHGYPGLKRHSHLAGNYGGAWQDQQREFDVFPGAILMTTNCIQRPRDSYRARIFTSGVVAWPGVRHIDSRDFSPVIDAAVKAAGFAADGEDKSILVGFGHEAVLGAADKVLDAVKAGAIRHFFLIGGCDGAKPGRNYYTEFAESAPADCVILTLACGKYRFNKLDFGNIGGIPRLLDIGQCNDAYSAIRIASALAESMNTDVNSLPLSLILSWYEQKAVCILLTLLSLGIRNIRLGPSLPAFLTPALLDVLTGKFGIRPITTARADIAAALAG
jgi:hydroxylamine reductase